MSQIKHVQSALGWYLIGLLLTAALISLIGFISPFWGLWQHPGDPYASRDLLEFWQPITAWFSIAFVPAAWHLARAFRSVAARTCIIALGVLVPVAHISATFAQRAIVQANSSVPHQPPDTIYIFVDMVGNMYIGLASVVFFALLWWVVRQCNRSNAAPLRDAV